MPTVAHVAESRAFDAHEAATTATEQALGGLGGPADLLLVFAATGYDQQTVIDAVRLAAPDVAVSGCSAEGVIAAAQTAVSAAQKRSARRSPRASASATSARTSGESVKSSRWGSPARTIKEVTI